MTKTLEMDGSRVLDMHLWKIAPGQIGCEIIIQRNSEKSSAEYRDLIQKNFQIQHLIIEVVKD
jgi:Co/Zn/Cd efflux system component